VGLTGIRRGYMCCGDESQDTSGYLEDLGSSDLTRYVVKEVTYASLDRVGDSQARLAPPVCRYKEGSVSDSADALVDKPAIQRYGADGGLQP
jgi:hypothetical protein